MAPAGELCADRQRRWDISAAVPGDEQEVPWLCCRLAFSHEPIVADCLAGVERVSIEREMPASGTKYARSGDVHIAYQVTGEGPDLLLVPDGLVPIEAMAEEPHLNHFLTRLSSFSRLIRFDRRGTGLSDRLSPEMPASLDLCMDDAPAVLDPFCSMSATPL